MVYDSYEFGKYLMELRRKDNLSMSVICEGICDVSVMSRIENGEREVSKLVQDRLLGRLGVASENFENMVFSDEYDRWRIRQRIISLIQHERIEEADRLLENMYVDDRLVDRRKSVEDLDAILELQFYLAMKAQVRRHQQAEDRELKALFDDALRQTVTGFEKNQGLREFFACRRFSVEELNLLIEHGRYLPPLRGITFLNHVISYIDRSGLANLARAKVFPKAVYYLYLQCVNNKAISDRQLKHLLEHATRAIEDLRLALRSFYLCELLDMKMKLIYDSGGISGDDRKRIDEMLADGVVIDKNYAVNYGNTSEFPPEKQYVWCYNVRKTLGDIYRRFGIREDTFEYCFIYLDMEVYCIEDIIRVRRNMLEMSMQRLCEGICSERTVSRIERKTARPRSAIVHKLFERLGLSGEFSRTELISSDVEMQEAFAKMRLMLINKQFDMMENILGKIKEHEDMAIPQNKQLVLRIEACIERENGELNGSQFIEHLIQALECTLPYELAIKNGDKYLTNEELSCITNILSVKNGDNKEVNECFTALCNLYPNTMKNINDNLSMYEFVTHPIASYLGDIGEYDKSDEREESILHNTLINRRITVAPMAMYGMLWNDMQRIDKGQANHRTLDWNEEIGRCATLADLSMKSPKYSFFISKLK